MSSSRAIRAGAAYVELMLSDNSLVRGLKSAQQRLKAFGKTTQSMGANLVGLSAAVGAPIAGAFKVFSNYSDKMAEVRAITGATAGDFEKLDQKAKDLGASTSFSASEVAEGMKFLGMAGFNTQQILAGIPAVLNLSRAGAIGLGEAADIASDVGTAFGLAADEIVRVADVMATTASSANTSISMMGETLKYAAPIAKEAGQSIEDTAVAIGLLGNSGIKASMAGTDLALMLKTLGSKDGQKALKKLGVDATDSAGNIRPLIDIMREVGAVTKNMTQSARLQLFDETFDRAAKSAAILSGGAGLDDLRKKINLATGNAQKMAGVMDDTAGGAFRGFMSAVESIAIAIGEALAPAVRDITNQLTDAARWIQNAVGKNRDLLVSIVKIVGIAAAAGAGLFVLGTVASAISTIFGLLAGAISMVGTVLGGLVGIFGALLSPIGLVTAAVVGLGAYLVSATGAGAAALDWLKEKFGSLKEDALMVFGAIRDALASGDFELAAKILWLGLKLQWVKGTAFLRQKWAEWKTTILKIATEAFYGVLIALNNAWAGLESAWIRTVDVFRDAWSAFTGWLLSSWNKVSGFIRKAWAKVKSVVAGTDASSEITRIENETKRANEEVMQKRNQDIMARENARKARLAQIERDRDGANTVLVNRADEINRQRTAQESADVAAAQADVAKARADLMASIDQVKQPAAAKTEEGPGGKITGPSIQDAMKSIAAGTRTVAEETKANTSASLGTDEGTRAILEALRGGDSDPASKTANNTKQMARDMKAMKKEQQDTTDEVRKGFKRLQVKRA